MNFLCFGLANLLRLCYTMQVSFGVWRSLVARTAGGREVAGSNPVAPTESWKNQGFPDFYKFAISITFIIFCITFYGLMKKIRRKSCKYGEH